ncbi:MAG: hypothetical protein WAV32_08255, partial [Halobacteriota archaeon]
KISFVLPAKRNSRYYDTRINLNGYFSYHNRLVKSGKRKYNDLLDALTTLYNCSENDVDRLLGNYPDLHRSFQTGAKVDVLLKVVKWMFIMEDIVYWNYKGRAMLYNAIMEAKND